MKKADLRPGMRVRNKISGSEGEIRGDEDGTLGYAHWCVGIRRKTKTGKNKGRYDYTAWNIKNLEILSGE